MHFTKDARERGEQCVQAVEITVVRSILAGVLPKPLGGIEFRRVGRQLMHFEPMLVGLEPSPYIGIFVIRGIVLNQDRSLATVPRSQLFEEGKIGGRIKDGVLAILEARAPEFDCAEDLHAPALSGHGNFRRATHAAPGGVEC